MKDVRCPYCGEWQEICHDDGEGYEEDQLHDQECSDCEKTFVFTTSTLFYYEAEKADCLNGEKHRFIMTNTTPRICARLRCTACGYEKTCPDSFKKTD